MTYHIIYKTTNMINGKYYYGVHSTDDLNDNYLGSGYGLKNAIAKYGKENFNKEIIAHFDDRKEALIYESKIVSKELVDDPMCYNSTLGGGDPPNRKGKVPLANKLKGKERTVKQKEASKKHSEKMKNREASNKKSVTIFEKQFESVKAARDYYNISISQYYFLIKSELKFHNPDELKQYIWTERSKKISESKNNGNSSS